MTIEEQVRRTKIAVNAVLKYAHLQQGIAKIGYDKKRVLEGKAYYKNVEMLNEVQQKEYGESYDATDSLRVAKTEARQLYMNHLETARFVLKDERGYRRSLLLSGERKRSLFGWLEQARVFYANVGPVKDRLARCNLSEEELQQGEAMIDAVYQAHTTRRKEFSEAKQATQNRDRALDEMNDWTRKFIHVAKMAFENDPEALELMGLVKTA